MTEETKLMLEIAKMRVLRKGKGKMLDKLQLRQSLLNELRELELYNNSQSLQELLNSEQYISKAEQYFDLLKDFANGNEEYDRLFSVLDCLKLDSNYTLALHLANDHVGIGDVSWFYCYEGNNDIYSERFNHPDREKEEDFFQCFGNLSEFEIFKHLTVENSEMGVWQAFLLSIAVTQLPTVWHGAYRRQDLLFTNEDQKRLHLSTMDKFYQRQVKPNLPALMTTCFQRCGLRIIRLM
jgi:hypothetical protein